MNRRTNKVIMILLVLLLLSGCSSTAFRLQYAMDMGRRLKRG